MNKRQKTEIANYFQSRPVELVYLFGSKAEKRAGALSDHDIGIVFDSKLTVIERTKEKMQNISFFSSLLSTDDVDVVDLNSASSILRYSAIQPRYELFVRSESMRVGFEHKTLKEYFDDMYYRKRHALTSIATIAEKGLSYE